MKLSSLRHTICEKIMLSQEMRDFVEDTVDHIMFFLEQPAEYFFKMSDGENKVYIFGTEVSSTINVKPSLPTLTKKHINVYLYIEERERLMQGSKGGIRNARSDTPTIYIKVDIGMFNSSKWEPDIRNTVTHELLHAFDPKVFYHKYREKNDDKEYEKYASDVSELDEFIESHAYNIAQRTRGNRNLLLKVLNNKDTIISLNRSMEDVLQDKDNLAKLRKRAVQYFEIMYQEN